MANFLQTLDGRRERAVEQLASGPESRLAAREQNDEFPFDLVNTFSVFLDYGSCVLDLSASRQIDWNRLQTDTVSPIALKRFFDVVVAGAAPMGQESLIPVDSLTDLHDIIHARTTEFSQPPAQGLYSDAYSTDQYLKRAIRLRTLLHQLADVEFLGEHNWQFRSYPVQNCSHGISTSVQFIDYDPLETGQDIPMYRVDVQYQPGSLTNNNTDSGPTEFPPIDAAIGGCVHINDYLLNYEELEEAIKQVRRRLKRASQALYSMSATDLRLYCSKCHLLPLFIATDIEWPTNDPTDLSPFDNITQSVQQRRHSAPALNEENLMTLEYFAALEQGANKIKSFAENRELALSPM